MLFNSVEFAIFLPVVFFLYWFVFNRNLRVQNFLLLVVSYVFYGWWDWRFLGLIVVSSFVDYYAGLALGKATDEKKRKLLLGVSLATNLGILGFFKYFNFFMDSLITSFNTIGVEMDAMTLQIILPVGISFYTFQTLSYSIDIYRKQLKPVEDMVGFFAFVSFFPQLVAGPIERASHLLPQFEKTRVFESDKAVDGVRQILWGLFKKVVIADNLAFHVNYIFSNYESLSASTLVMGAVFFAFQIYGDFSGYSDIAIGTARLFGFDLMKNFATPYFSRDIGEFWRRWHISLSTWFRDYVYIPLGGNRVSKGRQIWNSLVTFTVSGLWHGANWTFVIWGFLNGLYYVPSILLNTAKKRGVIAQDTFFPNVKEFLQMVTTFTMVTFAWIFFRATDVTHAFDYISHIFSMSLFEIPTGNRGPIPYILSLIVIEWFQRRKEHGLEMATAPRWVRPAFYTIVVMVILLYGFDDSESFIYFQF
ncbi:MAG: MBOAT family protein [Bacteroidetes bacterium]|nr:MBOAT family protein [Bacteroidota bacterium]MCB0842797.1 MBOAT family protein [Bacteroidota bacterium]